MPRHRWSRGRWAVVRRLWVRMACMHLLPPVACRRPGSVLILRVLWHLWNGGGTRRWHVVGSPRRHRCGSFLVQPRLTPCMLAPGSACILTVGGWWCGRCRRGCRGVGR